MMMHQSKGYSGGAVALAGGSSGAGRDVIFRLTVQPDPKAPRVMRMFGEDIRREQAVISNAAIRSAKDALMQWEKTGREQVRIFQQVQNVGTAAASQVGQAWRATGTTISRTLQQAQQLASISLPAGTATIAAAASASAGGGGGALTQGGRALWGLGKAIGPGRQLLGSAMQLGQAGLLAGALSSEDTQTIVNALITAQIATQGARGLWGLGTAAGLSAPVMASGGAAVAGLGAAGAVAYGIANDPGYAGRSQRLPNDFQGVPWWAMHTYYAIPGALAERHGARPYERLAESRLRGESQFRHVSRLEAEQERRAFDIREDIARGGGVDAAIAARTLMATLRGGTGAARQANALNLQEAGQELLRIRGLQSLYGASGTTGAESRDDLARAEIAAMQRVLALKQQQLEISQREGQERVKNATEELNKLRQLAGERKRTAEGAIGSLRSDLSLYGGLDPETQRAVFYSARQLRAGGEITPEQEQLLSQFSEFRDQITERQISRGARLGGRELFSGGYAKATRAQELAKQAETAVAKAELTLKQQLTINYQSDERAIEEVLTFLRQLQAKQAELERQIQEQARIQAEQNRNRGSTISRR